MTCIEKRDFLCTSNVTCIEISISCLLDGATACIGAAVSNLRAVRRHAKGITADSELGKFAETSCMVGLDEEFSAPFRNESAPSVDSQVQLHEVFHSDFLANG